MPSSTYLACLIAWFALLGLMAWWLIHVRRSRRRAGLPLRWVDPVLGWWCVLVLLTLPECWFAYVYDDTDSYGQTNVSRKWFERHVRPNQAGYRDDRDWPTAREAGVMYVGFAGDSFTFGHGIRRTADRFSDLVARRLHTELAGRVRVMNLALPGVEIRALTEKLVPELIQSGLPLDVLVYVFVPNDIEYLDEHTAEFYQQQQAQAPQFFLWRDTYFYNWLYLRVTGLLGGRRGDYYGYLAEAYRGPPWERFQSKLRELHRLCQQQAIELRVVMFPFLTRWGADDPFAGAYAQLAAHCREEGIACLDLRPVLEPHAAEGLVVSPFDAHPNETAHRLAAGEISRDLAAALTCRMSGNGPCESRDEPSQEH
jgi:hypothetical protein